jgi:hypothetical protein
MNENQTSWESREQQVVFAKNIASLLQKKFGSILSASYQGAGEVADLLITGRGVSASKMEEVRNFLTKSYKLDLHKIKNHGHVRGTILIHISEVSEASRKIVEEEILNKIILPERILKSKKNRQNISTTDVSDVESKTKEGDMPDAIKEEIIENQNPEKMEKEPFVVIKKGRTLLSVFLTIFFKFEGIVLSNKKDRIFSFDEKKTEDCQTISFRNEAEAEMGYKALTWYYDQAKDLPILEGRDVMVNFFSLSLERTKRPIYVSFCFPPTQGDSVEIIKSRAMHVLTGYKPSSIYVINGDSFSICYARLVTTQKFFELIKEMGWDAFMQDDLIICKFRVKPEIATDDTHADEVTPETEEITPVTESTPEVKEVTPVSEPQKKVLDLGSNFVSPRDITLPTLPEGVFGIIEVKPLSIKDLFSQAEAIEKFKQLHADEYRWKKIPVEKQKRIVEILKKDLKNSELEVFAEYLLGLKSLINPLFTKEEAILEFKLIMANSNFKHLSAETQNGILSALKDSFDDDEIIDDLLDLF